MSLSRPAGGHGEGSRQARPTSERRRRRQGSDCTRRSLKPRVYAAPRSHTCAVNRAERSPPAPGCRNLHGREVRGGASRGARARLLLRFMEDAMNESHTRVLRAHALITTRGHVTAERSQPPRDADGSGDARSEGPRRDPQSARARRTPRVVMGRTPWWPAAAGLSLWATLVVGFIASVGWSAPRFPSPRGAAVNTPVAQGAALPPRCGHTAADCPCRDA